MKKEILVAVKSHDRIKDIIPCLERVAQPGTKVTFLLRYPVDGFVRPKEEPDTVAAAFEAKKLADHYSWDANVKRAEKKLSPMLEVLRRNGVEATVDVYAGSLSKVVRRYALEGDIDLIMTRAGIGRWITSLLNGTISILELFNRPRLSPVLLIHPRAIR